ncbi:MAG: hypothetical protein IPL65_00415 [Lewinellaceae bacterium]|nr:hypothetical protein [Lewinellaceae bacterium]
MRIIFTLCLIASLGISIHAQSTAYVFKGGLSAGTQKWDNSQRQLLFSYHAALAIETLNNDDDRSSLYLQAGYHVKGSATRFRYINFSGAPGGQFSEKFMFRNLSLSIGAKQKYPMANNKLRYFYFAGIRGDYTLSTNLDQYQDQNNGGCNIGIYPFPGGVQKWMFGISGGGGLQWDFADLVGLQLELSVNPDLTVQYRTPSATITVPPCFGNPAQQVTLPERRIKNTTIELSVGLRLLRKVVLLANYLMANSQTHWPRLISTLIYWPH